MGGGGGCSTTDSCHNRSLGPLGTTNGDSESGFWINKNGNGNSYLSTNASINPIFHNWTMVYIRYCDGSSFSGLAAAPVVAPPGKPVYHSGNFILRGVIADLMKHNSLGKGAFIIRNNCQARRILVCHKTMTGTNAHEQLNILRCLF
eukprot:COSAG02_NODE_957_length_15660_cov_23.265793_14_plen_147_part_00